MSNFGNPKILLENRTFVSIMEDEGGWSLDETYYYIDNGCELVQDEDTL